MRILLADDHRIITDGLRDLLEKQPEMAVVGVADNGRSAVELVRRANPDVVVMDINMPDLNGIEAARQIVTSDSRAKIIALSMHSDTRMVREMLKAGASGYLLKDCAFTELTKAIKIVMKDQLFLSSGIADVVVEDYVRKIGSSNPSAFCTLTDREREVLQLLAEGKSTKQIASTLHLSAKTIETHRQQIMTRLNIYSVAELTKYAIREGLTTLDA